MQDGKLSRRSLALSLLGFTTLALGPARGQVPGGGGATPGAGLEPLYTPMEPLHEGTTPFTETVADMAKRDAVIADEIQRGVRPAPPPIRWIEENAEAEKMEEEIREKRKDGSSRLSSGPKFTSPPYAGRIDAQGHFTPENSKPPVGKLIQPASPQGLGTAFNGPNLGNSGYIPPDTQGAVGPNHVMFMVNGRVEFYTKAGAATGTAVSLDSFSAVTAPDPFTSVVTNYPRGASFDPRLLYDRFSGRWFATIMEFGSGSVNNHIILAISRTSDPTGTWDKYIIGTGVAARFTDYTTLGVDANGVYFGAGYPSQGRCRILSTAKASLLAVSPSLSTVFNSGDIADMFATPHPANNLDNSGGGRAWFVASSSTVFGNVNYRTLTWSGGTPSLSTTTVLTTPAYGGPLNSPANGSTTAINSNDDRILHAMFRNDQVWCTRHVGVNATGGSASVNRTAGEWIVMNASTATATLTQSGRIFDGATSGFRFYNYPAVAVSGQGHAALIFTGSRSTEFASIYTCGRLSADALGTMQAILQTQAGLAAYTQNDGGGRNRWGDYTFTCVDPNDDQSMWGFTQYVSSTNVWTVRVQKLLAPAPTAVATAVNAIPGQNNVSLPITGTGLFDPGSAFPNRLTATASGTGITNVRVAYINATKASVTFNVASNATTGSRNITITNPDGQAVTINNAINVVVGQPVLAYSRTISNVGGAWRVTLTITNSGGVAASNVRVLTSQLGTTATSTSTPVNVGTIAAGGSANVQLNFPLAAASSGVRVVHRATGDYTGGTFNTSAAVTPP